MPRKRKTRAKDKEQNNETKQLEDAANVYMNPGIFNPNPVEESNPYCFETNNYDNRNERIDYQRYQPIYYIYGYPPPSTPFVSSVGPTGDAFANPITSYENIIEQEVFNDNNMMPYDIPNTQPYVTIVNGVSYYMQPMLSSPYVTSQHSTNQQDLNFEQPQCSSSFCSEDENNIDFQENYYNENTNKNIYKTTEGYTVEEPSSGNEEKNPIKN